MSGNPRRELGQLLDSLARCVEFPIVFRFMDWGGMSYQSQATRVEIISGNIREFREILEDARKHCLTIGSDAQETLQSLAYANLEWNGFSDEWLAAISEEAENENDWEDLLTCVETACERIAEGCLITWKREAARWLAAGELENQPADTEQAPEWVTRKVLHDFMKRHSPSAAGELKSLQSWPGFGKVEGRKDHVADYQKLLPWLRENKLEFPWPESVSSWD